MYGLRRPLSGVELEQSNFSFGATPVSNDAGEQPVTRIDDRALR
jgi:hypothetical protein